jgi:cell division protein FtsZ
MAIRLSLPQAHELKPRIVVFGVGGGGCNAVNNMIDADLQGVEFVVANTDAQALSRSKAERRVQLGVQRTQGLGAGANPDVGMEAAEESVGEIMEHLHGAHMAFITAGMGGGTGTGAAPVIARAAREQGILTVAVVSKPFQFEGARRMRMAEQGIAELQRFVDTLIIIPNQNLFRVVNERTSFTDAFQLVDQVLYSGVRGITDLMVRPGLVNLDFNDVQAVMSESGKAMMGTGEASGERRAHDATAAAIANPLLDDVSLKGAKGVLINITGGMDVSLYEVDEAVNMVRSEVDPDANIIFGSALDPEMEGRIRISVVATGIDAETAIQAPPAQQARTAPVTPAQPQVVRVNRPAAAAAPVQQPAARTAAPDPVVRQQAAAAISRAAEAPREPAPVMHQAPVMQQAPEPAPVVMQPAAQPLLIDDFEHPDIPQLARNPAPQPAPVMRQPTPQPAQAPLYPPRAQAAPQHPEPVEYRRAAPAPAPEPEHPRDALSRLSSLFGGRSRRPEAAPQAAPAAGQRVAARQESEPFADELGEEVRIPAFLRRQAN